MRWPAEWSALFNALLLTVLLLPFVVYWSQGVLARPALRRLLVLSALVLAGIGAWQGASAFPPVGALRPTLAGAPAFLGLAMLVFMAVPLVAGWTRGSAGGVLGGWQYPRLFEVAWRNAVISVQAGVLTGLLWAVLFLGAQLFHLIGVDWPKETIAKAWFVIPVTTLAIALGLRAGLRRAAFTVTLRNHWLALVVWLLPLASLIGIAFVLTSLAGVDTLFSRGLSAFFLLWFAAFWIKFYNAAYQDGTTGPVFHPALNRILAWAVLALVGVTGLAAWALALRIHQYGLTPDRIWGALVVLVGLIYAVGYAVSLRMRGGWMAGIAPANVLAALVMALGIGLLLSPLLDVNRLATASQMARLASGRVSPQDFDVWALARQGRAGHDALVALKQRRGADGKPDALALRAIEIIDQTEGYARERSGDDEADAKQTRFDAKRIDVYPSSRPAPAALLSALARGFETWPDWKRGRSCFVATASRPRCALLQIDLDRDGRDEAVFWWQQGAFQQPDVYESVGGQWRHVGSLRMHDAPSRDEVGIGLATGDYAAHARRWDDLRIGKMRYFVTDLPDATETGE